MSSVNIKKRIRVNNKWTFAAVATKNGKRLSDHCMVNGVVEKHAEGVYYIEWYEGKKRTQRPVGKSLAEAESSAQIQLRILDMRKDGVVVEDHIPKQRVQTNCVRGHDAGTVADAIEKYLRDQRNISAKDPSQNATIKKYELILSRFNDYMGRGAIAAQVTRDNITGFMSVLRDQYNFGNRTRKQYGLIVRCAMTEAGADIKMKRGKKGDWPRVQQKEKTIYDHEEMRKFLLACSDDERVLFQVFLHTGFRDAEVGYLTWADVDFRRHVIKVSPKEEIGFTTKNYRVREVPVPGFVMEELSAWKKRSAKKFNPHNLVFPTDQHSIGNWKERLPGGKRNDQMLSICKEIAYRAGLNCGRCTMKNGTCDGGPYCSEWYLHKFRRTFATAQLQSGRDIATVQNMLGHSDVTTTMIYVRPADTEQVRKTVDSGILATMYSIGKEKRRDNVVSMAAGR